MIILIIFLLSFILFFFFFKLKLYVDFEFQNFHFQLKIRFLTKEIKRSFHLNFSPKHSGIRDKGNKKISKFWEKIKVGLSLIEFQYVSLNIEEGLLWITPTIISCILLSTLIPCFYQHLPNHKILKYHVIPVYDSLTIRINGNMIISATAFQFLLIIFS